MREMYWDVLAQKKQDFETGLLLFLQIKQTNKWKKKLKRPQ